MKFRLFYSLLLFCSLKCLAQDQYLRFENFNIEHGLSHNFAKCIWQDQQGFLWIGTRNGLNRYDSYSFRVFKNEINQNFSISNNQINNICERKNGELWIATGGGGINLYKPDLEQFQVFRNHKEDRNSVASDFVNCVMEDHRGLLWIGTEGKGLDLFDYEQNKFIHFTSRQNSGLGDDYIRTIFEDSDHRIWIGTQSAGIHLYMEDGQTFKSYTLPAGGHDPISTGDIRVIFEDSNQQLWIGTAGSGIFLYDAVRDSFRLFQPDSKLSESLHNRVVSAFEEDREGNIWIGTENGGLSVFDPVRGTSETYRNDELDLNSLSNNSILSLFKDDKDNLWIGTFNAGVDMINIDFDKIVHYRRKSDVSGLNHNKVLTIYEDSDSMIWIGTDGGGLNRFDPKTGLFKHYMHDGTSSSIGGNYVLSVCEMKNGDLWVGTWRDGITVLDKSGKIKTHYKSVSEDESSMSCDIAWVIFQDDAEIIWIGTYEGGLNRFDPQTNGFVRYPYGSGMPFGTTSNRISSIMQDRKGSLWIGTEGGGINRLDKQNESFQYYLKQESGNSISGNSIGCIHEDLHGNLWFGTINGLDYYDVDKDTFTNYSMAQGLGGNIVQGILEDEKGHLWISTNVGISRFNIETKEFKNYTGADGFQTGGFKELAYCRSKTGRMYFGGDNGFSAFWPDSIKDIAYDPPLLITGFQILDKELTINSDDLEDTDLTQSITMTDQIILPYHSTVINIDFASLNFVSEERKKYRYRLSGFESAWRDAGFRHSATYTNLDPGSYVFQVETVNNEGTWMDRPTELKLQVTPAFWQTWWFQTLVILGFIGAGVYVHIFQTRKVNRQKETLIRMVDERTRELRISSEQERQAREDAEQANKTKSVFLATMSHEIRTPMNGVIGMTNLLLETELNEEQVSYAETINTSAENLVTIINDILDFSKIESGKMEIEERDFDLRSCVEEVLDLFADRASKKGLDLIYQIEAQVPPHIIGDQLRLRQVLINLINNALKFTDQGEVFLGVSLDKRLTDDQVSIRFEVCDSGIGIEKDKQEDLFKAFSQVDSSITRKYGGTGLGLIICKRLVELMQGQIGVQSEEGIGSTFYFTVTSQIGISASPTYLTIAKELKGKRILIVDDNSTNLKILSRQLEIWEYQVVVASSANEALEILDNNNDSLDLVLTDMQMPIMNGAELSLRIKSKIPEIPIVLLSSMGDTSYKSNGNLFSAILTKPIKHNQLYLELLRQFKNPIAPLKTRKVAMPGMSADFAMKFPANILVAEDNKVNQVVILKTLNRLGYDPKIVGNGLEVLEELAEGSYDIVLMDVQMPEMDGLEATRQIRRLFGKHPFVIAMTANAMQSDRDGCLHAGMDDYISKPIAVEDLKDKLNKWATLLKV